MKNLILLLVILSGTISLYAHATTVVAEDTAEHTISFTFGRPSADSYLCKIQMTSPILDQEIPSYQTGNIMTFPDGSTVTGDSPNGMIKWFTRDTAPASSILHLGSASYGTQIYLYFCHDIQVPSENPGGTVETFYKIQTPPTWNYFTNANVYARANQDCQTYENDSDFSMPRPPDIFNSSFPLVSNSATDYSLVGSIPFSAGQGFATKPFSCKTIFYMYESATGPRPSNENPGNIAVGVKQSINFN